jgi:hypothetical protein
MASGHSRYVLLLAVTALAINCILGVISIPFGLTATAYGFAIRSYLILAIYLFMFKYVFGTGVISMLKTLAPAMLASAGMFSAVKISKQFFANHILLLCVIGALTYIILMLIFFRSETKNFFIESIDIAPAKLKPYIKTIQRIIKLS